MRADLHRHSGSTTAKRLIGRLIARLGIARSASMHGVLPVRDLTRARLREGFGAIHWGGAKG